MRNNSIQTRCLSLQSIKAASWEISLVPCSWFHVKTATFLDSSVCLPHKLLSRVYETKSRVYSFLADKGSCKVKVEFLQKTRPYSANTGCLNPYFAFITEYHPLFVGHQTRKTFRSIEFTILSMKPSINRCYQRCVCFSEVKLVKI